MLTDPPPLTEAAHEDDVRRVSKLRWLLLLPFAAMMWVPSYDSIEPSIASIPLFYWYQLLWVVLCGAIIGIVYLAEHR
ncbi:DUF3311 domain-containing protein [Aureimonas leprariae]|uniref:DUF3311 domain-containing protein n=1 Tax=Plantimonas leprariae TaxID=2615207 RepID=UPI0031B58FCB